MLSVRPISLTVEFFCMSNVNIIVDTKLQPNNNLCIVHIKHNVCTSNEEQIKGISSFDFGTCRSVEQ